jgi:CheY-like chemotaxis protein
VQRAQAAGFDLHLVKPVSIDRLDSAIASLDVSLAAQAEG